jgi:NADH-quinone oxidoreductase subunit L
VIHALAGEQDIRNMGGLKKYLPITYWTFVVGALAIAGFPLLSGFFSKDEILFRTYTAHTPGHLVFYAIAIVTSLLTATYMFRLVFLTFHGERRHDAPAFASGSGAAGPAPEHPEEEEPVTVADAHGGHGPAHGAHAPAHAVASHAPAATPHGGHGHGHGGGHGHTPHEAPWSMAIPLILLAIGSVVAGYVGVPHALGGNNRIESFLEPSFEAHAAAGQETAAPTAAETHEPGDVGTERTLMALSVGIALAGIGLAWYFWLANRRVVEGIASAFAPVHRLLLNKYYVDELYDAAIVQPIKKISTGALWKGVDAGLIDGTVNGVGLAVSGASTGLRRLQTGSIRTYAFALFAGVISILAYYLFN